MIQLIKKERNKFVNAEAESWEKSLFDIRSLVSSLYREFRDIKEKINEFDLDDFLSIALNKENANWE